MTMPGFLAVLLAESPSVRAAMKAGKKTSISAVVIRANGTIEDLGTISLNETAWRATLNRWLGSVRGVGRYAPLRFVWRGKEYERPID